MHSTIAFASSVRVHHFFRFSNPTCIGDQKDSRMSLPGPSPTAPNEGKRPTERTLWVKTHEVNRLHDRHG